MNYTTILFVFFISFQVLGQSHVFTGTGANTDWHEATNWSANTIPSSDSTVEIQDGFEVHISSSTAVANSINIQGSGTLIISNSLIISEILNTSNISVLVYEDGTIVAPSILNNGTFLITESSTKTFQNTAITNNNTINIENSNQIQLDGNVLIQNEAQGIINIASNGGFLKQNNASATLINDGIVLKQSIDGEFSSFYMILDFINHGILDVGTNNQLLFLSNQASLTNTTTGILSGTGTFDITSPFLNEGRVSPASENVGQLTFLNSFNLDGGTLVIDIEDANEFDTIEVIGTSALSGNIEIDVNYIPSEMDVATILTSQFTIDSCSFPAIISHQDNSAIEYIYNVECNENELLLNFSHESLIGIQEFSKNQFSITPNPTVASLTINIPSNQLQYDNHHFTITDINGQRIREEIIIEASTSINLSTLPSGIYFISLYNDTNFMGVKKFIKN